MLQRKRNIAARLNTVSLSPKFFAPARSEGDDKSPIDSCFLKIGNWSSV